MRTTWNTTAAHHVCVVNARVFVEVLEMSSLRAGEYLMVINNIVHRHAFVHV
mgnify:CR=1 FL=1